VLRFLGGKGGGAREDPDAVAAPVSCVGVSGLVLPMLLVLLLKSGPKDGEASVVLEPLRDRGGSGGGARDNIFDAMQ
jgi:hypothetical protein